jgi:hypothetical protein
VAIALSCFYHPDRSQVEVSIGLISANPDTASHSVRLKWNPVAFQIEARFGVVLRMIVSGVLLLEKPDGSELTDGGVSTLASQATNGISVQ